MDYADYSSQCKGNYFNLNDTVHIEKCEMNEWAATGLAVPFRWFAGSVYYDAKIHVMDAEKRWHNERSKRLVQDIRSLLSMINHSDDFKSLVLNPYVVNTEASYFGDTSGLYKLTKTLNQMFKQFFHQEGADVFYDIHENGNMCVNTQAIAGKDLILFYPFGQGSSLEALKRIGNSIMRTQLPHSIVGIFMNYVAPSRDGRYPQVVDLSAFGTTSDRSTSCDRG